MEKYILGSLIILALSGLYTRFQPKNINSVYGYRTISSRRSQKHWMLANHLASRVLLLISVILLCVSVFFNYKYTEWLEPVWSITLVTGIICLFIYVEVKLSKISTQSSS